MAKSRKIVDHIHKLKRIKYTNGEAIFFCINGSCEYELNVKKSLGKPNECHRCGKTFNLDELSMRLAKPHCKQCTKGKVKDEEEISIPIRVPSALSPIEDLRARLSQSIGKSIHTIMSDPLPEDDSDLL